MKNLKRLFWASCACCLLCFTSTHAQTTSYLNSVNVSAYYVSLGSVPNPGIGYDIGYARHFASNRFAVGGTLGYISAPGEDFTFREWRTEGQKSERITVDLTLSYNFLRGDRHALRLGAGPSVWSRKDDLFVGYNVDIESVELDKVRGGRI